MFPLTVSGAIDKASIINNHTYLANEGVSMTHIINGMAGNIESHSELSATQSILNITAVLDVTHYGLSRLTVNATALKFEFILGVDGSVGDEVVLLKKSSSTGANSTATATSTPPQFTSGANRAGPLSFACLTGVIALVAYML